jgi:hypothetical protein
MQFEQSTPVTTAMVKQLSEDIIRVTVDVPLHRAEPRQQGAQQPLTKGDFAGRGGQSATAAYLRSIAGVDTGGFQCILRDVPLPGPSWPAMPSSDCCITGQAVKLPPPQRVQRTMRSSSCPPPRVSRDDRSAAADRHTPDKPAVMSPATVSVRASTAAVAEAALATEQQASAEGLAWPCAVEIHGQSYKSREGTPAIHARAEVSAPVGITPCIRSGKRGARLQNAPYFFADKSSVSVSKYALRTSDAGPSIDTPGESMHVDCAMIHPVQGLKQCVTRDMLATTLLKVNSVLNSRGVCHVAIRQCRY